MLFGLESHLSLTERHQPLGGGRGNYGRSDFEHFPTAAEREILFRVRQDSNRERKMKIFGNIY